MVSKVLMTASLAALALVTYSWVQKPVSDKDKVSPNKTAGSRLEAIKLEIHTVGGDFPYEEKYRYHSKDAIRIRVLANNTSANEIVLPYTSSFVHYLPEISSGGKVLTYSAEMQKRISNPTKSERDSGSFAKLPPNRLSEAAIINLADWYGDLEPGVFNLRLTYRLYKNGPEVESPAILFEVLPETR